MSKISVSVDQSRGVLEVCCGEDCVEFTFGSVGISGSTTASSPPIQSDEGVKWPEVNPGYDIGYILMDEPNAKSLQRALLGIDVKAKASHQTPLFFDVQRTERIDLHELGRAGKLATAIGCDVVLKIR